MARNPSLRCDRGKGTISAIAIERVGPVVGHIQIALPVAVVIPHGHSHAPAAIFDASYNRRKGAAVVAIEHIARPRTKIGIGRAIYHIQIEIAVAVVVEKRRAAAGRFEDEALVRTAADGGMVQTSFSRRIYEEGIGLGVGDGEQQKYPQMDADERRGGRRRLNFQTLHRLSGRSGSLWCCP